MSKVFSVRLADEVAERVEGLAAGRSIRPAAWLKEAVASYLDDHGRGLPDAPRAVDPASAAARPEQVREARRSTSSAGGWPRESGERSKVTKEEVEARLRERDRILAEARASVVRRGP